MKVLCALGAVAVALLARSAFADPAALSDAALADVTAGNYLLPPSSREGDIVGNSAGANVRVDSTVMLDAQAQRRAKGMAVVNGAQSDVANGSNVWDGRAVAAQGRGDGSVIQGNQVRQQGPAAASLADWQLHDVNVTSRRTETHDSEFTGGIIAQDFTFTGAVTSTTTRTDADNKSSTSSRTSHPTETLKIGMGVAMAGDVDVATGAAGVLFSDYKTVDTTTTATTSYQWDGIIIDFTIEGSVTVVSHVEGGVSGGVSLQPFSLQAKGVICQTLVGSCQPYVGHYDSFSHTEETTVFPARLRGASAERIVVSDGKLQEEIEDSVTLEGQAQRDLRALHAVNAAGGQVANGVNVSRGIAATTRPRAPALQQHNQINQRQ